MTCTRAAAGSQGDASSPLPGSVEPRPELSFSDLILPPANQRQLTELRNRIRYRSDVLSGAGFEQRLTLGKGLITLFTGTSGTGKTMAAQLLAGEQGVDLYKIDMSAVVSKYVGETEKNLSRVFAEAEDSNAIIFFDEADALFGKRGKVEEARDRWANMEVNYLLQRVEEYAGVVVLATNLRQNIDEAFIRRIHIIVDFPFPEAEARYSIWFGLFPPGVRRPPKDQLVKLTKFSLAGGSIQNIVIDATYRPRARKDFDENGRLWVRLRDLVLGTAREYQKLGRPLSKGEFDDEFFEWIEDDILLAAAPAPEARYRFWVRGLSPEGRTPHRSGAVHAGDPVSVTRAQHPRHCQRGYRASHSGAAEQRRDPGDCNSARSGIGHRAALSRVWGCLSRRKFLGRSSTRGWRRPARRCFSRHPLSAATAFGGGCSQQTSPAPPIASCTPWPSGFRSNGAISRRSCSTRRCRQIASTASRPARPG